MNGGQHRDQGLRGPGVAVSGVTWEYYQSMVR